jgi:hypothetical protein
MGSAETNWAALTGHFSTPGGAARGIDARVEVDESGRIVFRYLLRAQTSSVRVPPAQPAERADGLWRHTCFEAFVSVPGAAGYYELNFAPSRQWAVYRFDAYRKGGSSVRLDAPPEISVRCYEDRLEVDAAVHARDLSALAGSRCIKLGLSAVVEEEDGRLSYWALKHAPGKPDFHNPRGFALELTVQGLL